MLSFPQGHFNTEDFELNRLLRMSFIRMSFGNILHLKRESIVTIYRWICEVLRSVIAGMSAIASRQYVSYEYSKF